MRVKVLFFARLRELAGRSEWTCEVADGARVRDIWSAASAAHPSLAPFQSAVSCAINADFATSGAAVRDGDEVAFLPPVSGGSAL
jgi:molybdopterin converting factor subunit 1